MDILAVIWIGARRTNKAFDEIRDDVCIYTYRRRMIALTSSLTTSFVENYLFLVDQKSEEVQCARWLFKRAGLLFYTNEVAYNAREINCLYKAPRDVY